MQSKYLFQSTKIELRTWRWISSEHPNIAYGEMFLLSFFFVQILLYFVTTNLYVIISILGHVQTNSSKAGLSKACAVFYVSVIPISVARQVAWSKAEQSCPDTNRNNTNIKHRAHSDQPCYTLVCLDVRNILLSINIWGF